MAKSNYNKLVSAVEGLLAISQKVHDYLRDEGEDEVLRLDLFLEMENVKLILVGGVVGSKTHQL